MGTGWASLQNRPRAKCAERQREEKPRHEEQRKDGERCLQQRKKTSTAAI